MINNIFRIGNFTSSQIHKLVGPPAPLKTYLTEKNLERVLNSGIESEAHSNAMAWGNFLEQRVHNLLGFEYELCSNETDLHPTIICWAGSKDFIVKGKKIAELKCFQLKNFSLYTNALLTGEIEIIKKEFPKEYWQAVSNAIINEVPNAELITYCPYESELDEIREMAMDYIESDAWKYRFIYESSPENLPHLKNNGFYKNLNRFEFEVPKADIDLLTEKVNEASKKLIDFFQPA